MVVRKHIYHGIGNWLKICWQLYSKNFQVHHACSVNSLRTFTHFSWNISITCWWVAIFRRWQSYCPGNWALVRALQIRPGCRVSWCQTEVGAQWRRRCHIALNGSRSVYSYLHSLFWYEGMQTIYNTDGQRIHHWKRIKRRPTLSWYPTILANEWFTSVLGFQNRPDTIASLLLFAQFRQSPTEHCQRAVKKILRYRKSPAIHRMTY